MATSRAPFLCRVAAAPDPAYIRDRPAGPGKGVGPRKRQRRRAMATGREPFLCRVAAAPDPAYMRDGTAGPGKRSATGEGRV
ncbi:TPA: hypothetical protein MHS87_05370 [Klebsiella pneumoniae]|nr:hypothetical protein [Klebsiella pneumoniae]OYG24256.1 hypothetical protein CI648_25745 [Klebsiella pneumoniae subsp. pneumoniae]PPJ97506.1 hypothetical protein CSC89_27310 [Klebsiella pneumoniae]HBX2109874.1 hypothetical protein [Klebsiella pneumoniae]HBX2131637.1 hypothetical protein [Klebsiella pneumoniae]